LISFRYHLVSIVAVFFALALGMLMGTNLLNQGVIEELQRQTDAAKARANNLREELDRVDDELTTLQTLTGDIEDLILDGKLADRETVIVTADGVDVALVADARDALERAGAEIVGLIFVTPRIGLEDDAARSDLAGIVGGSASDPTEALATEAGAAFGQRLVDGSDGFGLDVLAELSGSGFVSVRGQTDLTTIGGSDQVLVALAGDDDEPSADPVPFLMSMLDEVVQGGGAAAAAEVTDPAYQFVSLVRDLPELDGNVVTVDNGDSAPGRLGLVLGLERLLQTGQGGDYGIDGDLPLIPPP
jgi:hypothetical protein